MSVVTLAKGRLLVLREYGDDWFTDAFQRFAEIPGVRLVGRAERIRMSPDPRLVELLKIVDPNVKLDKRARDWYDHIVSQEDRRIAYGRDEDASIKYPTAEKLWPFQRAGANFLMNTKRCLLCDEPGLGKTATTIVAVEASRRSKRVLVVCPSSLKDWWRVETERWAVPTPNITVIQAATRERQMREYFRNGTLGWLILNWELLRLMPQLRETIWDWIVCDEAHRVKNRKTQVFGALNRLKSARMTLLTGTPFANHPAELWTLLHLVEPKKYTSYWRFFEMYVAYKVDWWGHKEIRGARNVKLLRRELSSRMLRRTKEYCLPQLPSKTYKTIPLRLTARQRKMYKDMAREMLVELEDGDVLEAPTVMAMITRLRQITSTTATLEDTDHSAKLDATIDLIRDTDEKVVVFTQFRNTVTALCQRLARERISYTFVWGGQRPGGVSEAVQTFQDDPAVRVFVGTTQTGGVGLTLTAARTLVFIDKHWNPAQQAQAEDRIHRIGQHNAVQIIDLHCIDTVDRLVDDVLHSKLRTIKEVLAPRLREHLEEVVSE